MSKARAAKRTPRFSVVVPLYNTADWLLAEMAASVIDQTFADWELVLVDDHSPDRTTVERAKKIAASDDRITVIELPGNLGISGASNAGLDAAHGEFIALLDHDDALTHDALARFEAVLRADDTIDYAYSDQDLLSSAGAYFGTFRKPIWSPERFLGQMYTSHLSVFRRSLLEQTGGFRADFDGSQDHDLILRLTEHARTVAHVPGVLYHWRAVEGSTAHDGNAKSYAWEAGRAAVAEAATRRGISGTVVLGPSFGTFSVRRTADLSRTSAIVLLDGPAHALIANRRGWAGSGVLETIAVTADGTPPADRDDLRAAGCLVVTAPDSSSRAERLQLGAAHASGEVLLFLSSEVSTTEEALVQLAGPLAEDGIGLTGARLLAGETIAHAGYRHLKGTARDAYRGAPAGHPGHYGDLLVNREVSAVSSRFAAINRSVFARAGGFNASLDEFSADLDLAQKVRSEGLRVLSLSSAQGMIPAPPAFTEPDPASAALIERRWGWPAVDPYVR